MKISKDLYMRISGITGVDYTGVIVTPEEFYLENETIIAMIEDLFCEIDSLEEKIEDMEQDIRDNYKPISPYEMYGMSERDFH